MKLCLLAPLFAASLMICSNGVTADDQPPSAPEVTYASYSSTATEIFWTRSIDDNIALNYELTRNGQLLYSGNGLSYFDNNLVLGERYVYTVTVTGLDGLTSTPVSITVQNGEIPSLPPLLPPTGLTASVYSDSALELFWDRVEGQTLTYFYYQDGALIDLTDGTSAFIDENISLGVYTFEVQARRELPGQGGVEVSDRVSIEVAVPGGPVLQPSAPENVTLQKYSSTAAELFWDRPASSERVVTTDVYRDSVLIGSTVGTSYFDDERERDVDYTYTLIAVNADGIESEPTQYSPTTSPVFVVNEDNVEEVVFNISRISRGLVLNDLVQRAEDFISASMEGLTLVSVVSQDFEQNGIETISTYSCQGGGSVVITEPASAGSIIVIADITDCNLNGRGFNGQARLDFNAGGRFITTTDFTTIFPDTSRAIFNGVYSPFTSVGVRLLEINSYEEINADGTQRPVNDLVSTAMLDVVGETDAQLTFESQWTASGPFSNNVTLDAQTTQQFMRTSPAATELSSGKLVVTAETGLVLTIDADTGEPTTFSVTVQDGDSLSTYSLSWTDRNRLLID